VSEQNGTLPHGWIRVKLGDVLEFKYGKALPAKQREGSRYPVFGSNGIIGQHSEALVGGPVLILGRKGSIGEVHQSDGPCSPIDTTYFIDNFCGQPVRFWYYRLKALPLAELNRATALPGLNRQDAYDLEITLPPLAEQQRVGTKIEALRERSRRAREALAEAEPLLEQFRQSVLAAAFRGDLTADWRAAHPGIEPASELLHRIRAERRRRWEQAELAKYEAKGTKPPKGWQDKYEEPESVDDSTLPKLPSSWEWVRVKDIGEVQLGRQRAPQYHSGPHMRPYLRVMNVFEDRIDTADIMEMDFSPEEFERYCLEPGDILLNEGQSRELVGRSAIYRGEIPGACFTNTLVRFRPDAPIESEYPQIVFLGYLKTGRFQRLAALTVNIAHLGAGRFADMAFPLPPLEEQAEIVRRARVALDQITRLEEKLRATFVGLDQLDQSILAKAFRGELVPQDPNDEPASVLLARIRDQRMQQTEAAKHKPKTLTTQRGNKRSEESSRPTPQQLTLTEVLLTED
jgi:type I restriction enzyme S subunit